MMMDFCFVEMYSHHGPLPNSQEFQSSSQSIFYFNALSEIGQSFSSRQCAFVYFNERSL
jgi:hypothetical protein